MKPSRKSERGGAALLAGIVTAGLLALAMPGHTGWWPLLFVALTPLLLAVPFTSPRRSLVVGFLCGLLYHLALLYWILIVLGRYGGLPWWLSAPALLLLASYLACYPALFSLLLNFAARRSREKGCPVAALIWAAPVLWVGLDYLRSVLLSGFPWMDLGYGLFSQPRLIQAADLGGHHLLTFCLVLCNGLVAVCIDRSRCGIRWTARREQTAFVVACVFLACIGSYSLIRYRIVQNEMDAATRERVAVVQGNIDQAIKWTTAAKEATVATYLRLSQQALQEDKVALLIWPETALPFFPQQDPLIGKVFDFATKNAAWILSGAPLYSVDRKSDGTDDVRYYNGALLLGPSRQIGGQHAKQHLVPFGEYVPLRQYLPFLEPLVVSVGDFSTGTQKGPLVLGSMKLGMLICYESIFPEIARDAVIRGANVLVNITNDAWYGRSSAPYQSMAMAVLRSVENRRTLLRAANTGISGFVDPLGRVINQSAIFTEAVLTASVPIFEQSTVFCRLGCRFGAGCFFLAPLLVVFAGQRRA